MIKFDFRYNNFNGNSTLENAHKIISLIQNVVKDVKTMKMDHL